eukprot:CAMPEP_0205955050 /NCGR_PEP_ID=MMETSP1459-20131121/28743_1 /ASSEMBLY_ACC=CAM_ASM_001120 /TAXON_ID=41880 /ORGANISM="Pycnococcus provasolii, Strain RCC931" /LENGTH=385 /DNA_ID=CAMNT_0053327355 /DNA_START=530 /DNA_END=1687 /DNA_ORIENTATION=+
MEPGENSEDELITMDETACPLETMCKDDDDDDDDENCEPCEVVERQTTQQETHARKSKSLEKATPYDVTLGNYGALEPGNMLDRLVDRIPQMTTFADLDLYVLFNEDSSNVGPDHWVTIAEELDARRDEYDAFILVHGTDTMAFTASALSLMLVGFGKPIVITGSQLPLGAPRTDARMNLIDSVSCATNPVLLRAPEVCVCFDGKLLRGNRTQKVHASSYTAFDSPGVAPLAMLGVDIVWGEAMLDPASFHDAPYTPRFDLDTRVLRVPVVPGVNPYISYGDCVERGVRGIVLEVFGVGNMPNCPSSQWLRWLEDQADKGLKVYLTSQCASGDMRPELYQSGSVALRLGAQGGPRMIPECAVVKLMLCLSNQDVRLSDPIAGELG